ncbi:Mis14-domain-containing protein [Aspergillus heteromorphus CBS 117.55]|uniref:Mis14-domain-containing protein n=1 Tax=Aspergillus heteromorphus CBS 117.55 TaxID=1448321 RepID=A0A317X6S6_9EURO|nr:Mis14-domain-containing protein [Aspergillus heteromorphus CBS 117.55]PWY92578.1 Mis14-domain-containing protein [Aspergillus heteromorphus CBS 117.55]
MDHHRLIELQSAADFTYLYGNTVALSRQKLDLHLPPSANPNDGPDPMRERVRELVDEYIHQTFHTASSSISINGLDSTSPEFPFPGAFTAPTEQVEYEAYDGKLASRVTSLYAQLESLTTTVAQLRRDAPGRAARAYAEKLSRAIEEDDDDDDNDDQDAEDGEGEDGEEMKEEDGNGNGGQTTSNANVEGQEGQEGQQGDSEMVDADNPLHTQGEERAQRAKRRAKAKAKAKLNIPLGTEHEAERWRGGEMAEVYEDALRTLLRLQGESQGPGTEGPDGSGNSNALASTLGKAERAGRAVEVVEKK